jgi:hypothetical protein
MEYSHFPNTFGADITFKVCRKFGSLIFNKNTEGVLKIEN